MESRWRLILQKDISSAYAMALDDALHRVAAEEQIGLLHLYSTVPSLLLGRWQRMGKEGRASEERDVNRRPSGGGSITGGENVLLFSLALPSCCCDQWSKGLERASDVMKSLLKGRLCADGLIRDTKTVKGMLTVCSCLLYTS
ncbi:MAG: hypothetical protein N2234_05645, partial [Planctomycetota bacterium]|nr:hypothetical protein [Planctomycetota bacterium]